ncbi:unnamed protein product [Caenorhabditis sp. 36 PRJEB53466]|nr:unnamed protein product [Caenorhabditis sp. 36 PRJEB53466]
MRFLYTLVVLLGVSSAEKNDTLSSVGRVSDAVKVKNITGKVTKATLQKDTVDVFYKELNKSDINDLLRISVEILDPQQYANQDGAILDVTAANGRDSFPLKLPVVYSNLTLFTAGKMLNPLLPEDFGMLKRTKKNILERNELKQNLVVTVQSRLHVDIEYRLQINTFDKSQYFLRFKPEETTKVLSNQHLTYSKPIGFLLDGEEQNVKSFHITLKSDDDICASLVTIPANESIYERSGDSNEVDNRRSMTFTKRADVFFSETEISTFKQFRIFAFINPDDSACSSSTSRKSVNENKVITFEFVKIESQSYFFPVMVMIAFFAIPTLGFVPSLLWNAYKGVSALQPEVNLISLESDSAEQLEPSPDSLIIPGEESIDEQIMAPKTPVDSLSLNGEMLRYPVAIILPVLMHTAVEYHKWTTSTMANRDEMCFHNHACARPYGELRAWNNVISNIGYAFYGLTFIAITLKRRWRLLCLKEFGTFECTLLDVTIGVFMILQSIASATYHICPSDVAFQFDTPCIQVICGLLIIRQWLVRSESPSAAYSNILLVGIVSLNFFVSAFSKTFYVRYLLAVIHMVVLASLCSAKRRVLSQNANISKSVFLVFAIVLSSVNIATMMFYLTSSVIHLNQISTYCFILNCIGYLVYYAMMKAACQEMIARVAKLYGALAVIGWVLAAFFFFQDGTDWTKSAAASRALNKPCLLLDFFGAHDLWHIFGAVAGLFTFLFVSFVDDDLLNTPTSSVNLF